MPSASLPSVVLAGQSEMHRLTRDFDWSGTPIGPFDQWPESLKTTVRIVLGSRHPMFIWWGPELIQFYNDAYRHTMGPERHPRALGQPGRECWQEIWPIIGPQIESVMAGGPPTWHEDQLVRVTRHGRYEDVWWTYGYSPIEDADGVQGVLVVCNDVTREHLVTDRLRQANEQLAQEVLARRHEADRLQTLFEQAPGFMCILRGPDHVFEFANRAYMRLVGDRPVVGLTVRAAFPDLAGQGFFELLDQVRSTGELYVATDVPMIVEKDGQLRALFVDFVYQPIIEADGSVSGVFVEGSDVTDRRWMTKKLKETDRRKDEFLATLAHEMRNPLAPISSAAQSIQTGRLDEPRLKKASAIIVRQVGHLSKLVDDLMDVSRVTRGLVTLGRVPTDLNECVRGALEQLGPVIDARTHQLSVSFSEEPARVSGDPVRLIQIASNLLNNAFKYTPVGGRITVAVESDATHIELRVSDDGIGMEPELVTQVFDLFVQGQQGMERSKGGLGIGLAVVKTLVELHGGTISADSPGAGQGSAFRVRLPRLSSEGSESTCVAVASASPRSDVATALPDFDRRRQRDRRRHP